MRMPATRCRPPVTPLPTSPSSTLELADGHTGSGIAQTLQAMGVKVIVLSGHPNVGAGLGTVPHTYAAKPISPAMVDFLLNPTSTPSTAIHAKFAGASQAIA